MPPGNAVLLISCPDRKGLVALISDFVYRHNGNILHADEHSDAEAGLFLMRGTRNVVAFAKLECSLAVCAELCG